MKRKANNDLSVSNMEITQRAADHDQVFIQMKQVTGANSLQDVVDKFAAQSSSNTSLEKEKARVEARLATAKAAKEQCLKQLNDLKASGIGGIELNREVYTALENDILQAKGMLKANKAAYDCLDGVLAAVRQGAHSLVQRLIPFEDILEINDDALLHPSGKEGVDFLAIAEVKLAKIIELVGQQNGPVGGYNAYGGDGDDAFDDHSKHDMDDNNMPWSPTGNSDPIVHKNNVRVKPLKPFTPEQNSKPNSTSPRDESARSDSSAITDGEENGESLVPSRDILKMSSNRHFAEVMRKKEVRCSRDLVNAQSMLTYT